MLQMNFAFVCLYGWRFGRTNQYEPAVVQVSVKIRTEKNMFKKGETVSMCCSLNSQFEFHGESKQ